MSGILRTVGVAMLAASALPVAAFTGLASIILILVFIFSPESRSFGLFLFFLVTAAVCYFAIKSLQNISKRGHSFVKNINAQEGLNLNPNEMLGYPSPTFCVFDKNNRKLAICNSVTKDYKVRDFDYVLQWYYEWGTGTRMDVGVGGAALPKTNVRGPAISHSEYKKNFLVVLEVADENNPLFKFQMQNEEAAKRWCAKLNAIFNG